MSSCAFEPFFTTKPEGLSGPVEGGVETLLGVEDDAEVLKAPDAQSALIILQSGVQVDLLFTDVVMPGPMRSTELVRHAKALLPDLEVLFTSGYTENAIVHGGRLDAGVHLLSKPHRREDLARKVRQLLNHRQQQLAARQPPPAPGPRKLRCAAHGCGAAGHVRPGAGPAGPGLVPGMKIIIASGHGSAGLSVAPGGPGELGEVGVLPKPYALQQLQVALEQGG